MKIGVVGTGISGLVAGWLLSKEHDVEFFEKASYPGGHSNTVLVSTTEGDVPVDTGFIVYNETTYPLFTRILNRLDVPTQESDMSFSVACERCRIEYASSAAGLFASPACLLSPGHYNMIAEMFRFFREAPGVLAAADAEDLTLGAWLEHKDFSDAFRRHFLLPLGGAVWSSSPDAMESFPAAYFVQFFKNHGFLGVNTSPQWRTISGGSREYVRRILAGLEERVHLRTPVTAVRRTGAGVEIRLESGDVRMFDALVLATHSDQALNLLEDPVADERDVLSGIPYTQNEAVLHTDETLLPRYRGARASWNVHLDDCRGASPRIAMTYDLSRLQSITTGASYCVTLNETSRIRPDRVIRRIPYEHPSYSVPGLKARAGLDAINGRGNIWFCGAWCRYGFHEDGVESGVRVAQALGASL